MKELVRAIGGLLTIVTILGLVAADVLVPGATLSLEHLRHLILLVGGLLGLDILVKRIPVSIDLTADEEDE